MLREDARRDAGASGDRQVIPRGAGRPSCPGFDGLGCAFVLRAGESVCIVCQAVREGRHKLLMPDGSPCPNEKEKKLVEQH